MRLIVAALIWLCSSVAMAADLDVLRGPGVIGLMRHALAPGTSDPAGFVLEDCDTQRNLDDRGRDQARRIGLALREAGIGFDAVWTSQWCRAAQTAALLDLGPPQEMPALNSFFQRRAQAQAQTEAVLQALAELPPGARVILVSHQVNISALVGRTTRSGEIIATRLRTDGSLELLGSVAIAP